VTRVDDLRAASRSLALACLRCRADMLANLVAAGEFDYQSWETGLNLQRALLEDAHSMLPNNVGAES
jgi:hypothetical protein